MSRLLQVRLPVSVRAPGIARREIRRLTSELGEQQQEDLALLVSELVSNSVQHARHSTDFIDLKTWVVDTAVRVSVTDSGTGFAPTVVVPEPHEEGHRGLWLVDMLADTWGISVDGATSSWFEMHGPPASSQRSHGLLELFLKAIVEWPLGSRELAWSMATSLGPPTDIVANRLTWTTAECVATILCPDQQPCRDERRRHGPIEDRNGRWWLETLRNHHHHHHSAGGSFRVPPQHMGQDQRSSAGDPRAGRSRS